MEDGMTTHNSASHAVQKSTGVEARPIADFHPSVWGDYFLNYTADDKEAKAFMAKQLQELEEEVRKELLAVADKSLELLNFIDAIQRLGVTYHFEEEIEDALQKVFDSFKGQNPEMSLYYTSLQFRLLRQQGLYISCEVFNKFIDEKGSFNESIKSDISGILQLYEASQLRTHGDEILDKALEFTTAQLKSVATKLSEPLATQVLHALKQPLYKGMTRLESRHYITFYEQDTLHNKTLLKFAKLDFNLVQSLHKEELRDLTRWWRDIKAVAKLPFIRDRVAEGFFWALGAFYEPKYSLGRIMFMKVFKVMSIIDDIYDAYGTIEELELFTRAVERWDYSCLNELPEYMNVGYQPLLDIVKEFEEELAKEGRSHYVKYLKDELKAMCGAYMVEARWRNQKCFPTLDEYLNEAAIVSFGYNLATTVCYLGMGELATKEAFDWASQNPNIVRASGIIGRLMDDMASHEFEQTRDHVPSAVECHKRQCSVSEKQVRDELDKRVTNAWKDINQALIRPTVMPSPLLTQILNLCRAVDVIYKGEDTYTFANRTMKNNIAMILTDPIPI